MPDYSIVIPVYNEDESLDDLFAEITGIMDRLQRPYEIIFVDDLSSDRSLPKMESYRQQRPDNVRIIKLEQRSGQTYALRKGLDAVKGDGAVTLDADLQNDPADIPKLIAKLDEGYDVVCGWRKARMDKPLKMVLSKSGNILQRAISGFHIHDVSCTLRAYRKHCIPKIALNWEGQHRFMPLSLFLQGYKVDEIVSNHRTRKYGYSKYSHKRIFKVAVDFFKVLISRGRK